MAFFSGAAFLFLQIIFCECFISCKLERNNTDSAIEIGSTRISCVNCSPLPAVVFKMAAASGLTVEAIRDFMLENGGKVTNHDLVKHFKRFLTNPETRGIDYFLYRF